MMDDDTPGDRWAAGSGNPLSALYRAIGRVVAETIEEAIVAHTREHHQRRAELSGPLMVRIGRAVESTARKIAQELLEAHERQSHDMLAGLIDEHERRYHGGK